MTYDLYTVTWRDKIAHKLANAALLIASPHYRNIIQGSILYGLWSAARDTKEGNEPPPDPFERTQP